MKRLSGGNSWVGGRFKFYDLVHGQLVSLQRVFTHDLFHFPTARGLAQDQRAGLGLSPARQDELAVVIIFLQERRMRFHKVLYRRNRTDVLQENQEHKGFSMVLDVCFIVSNKGIKLYRT